MFQCATFFILPFRGIIGNFKPIKNGRVYPAVLMLMRVFKDLDLVEHLGSGVPRILTSYGRECFKFTENFLRMTFPSLEEVTPHDTPHDTPQVTPQVTPQGTPHDIVPQVKELLTILEYEMTRQEIQTKLKLYDRKHLRISYLNPSLELSLIEMTLPDKPNSSLQKYRLTQLGHTLKQKL